MRRWLKRGLVGVALLVCLVLAAGTVIGIRLHGRVRASLPQLDGERALPGLRGPVTVARDADGVPALRGSDRTDLARVTGFVHAQDRFFQMDLTRRAAAGELSALFGTATLETDRNRRIHRFRELAGRQFRSASARTRELMRAYTEGANAGLLALGDKPVEYLILRTDPEPWRPEDCLLVLLSMYLNLQGDIGARESDLGVLYETLPEPLANFLAPAGSNWDAPVVGVAFETPPIPPPSVFDLRRRPAAVAHRVGPSMWTAFDEIAPGSNNWAISGELTRDGGALLANDMHLSLSLPNIWYRASLVYPDPAAPEGRRQVTGVTLPGTPLIVSGSNGQIAWGFTNTYGDWVDLVVLETDPSDEDRYRTPQGMRSIVKHREVIEIHGAPDEILDVPWTIWGPVLDRDHRGRRRASRWVAYDRQGVNSRLFLMEQATTLEQALDLANGSGIPAQNTLIATAGGRIGWTVMGAIPRRMGGVGRLPRSWADRDTGWDGYLSADEYPRVVDPPRGLLWTANNRVVDGEMLERIGDGGFIGGARATQIRDALLAVQFPTEEDLLRIQLDDRALFLRRWRELLLEVLNPPALVADPRRATLRRLIEDNWSGRASIDSAAYRMVRAFRLFLSEQVFDVLTADCRAADSRFDFSGIHRFEGPLWRLVSQRPLHLLNPVYETWDEQLLAAVDQLLDHFLGDDDATGLSARTWGQRNTVQIRHPLSLALPQLSRWLDVPAEALPGDSNMPRVQGRAFGASERLVVSPGREERGLFHMPGGQCAHPLSPYYRRGHRAWAEGRPTRFLPGPREHELTFVPGLLP